MPQNNQFNRSSGSDNLPQPNIPQLSTTLPISEELLHDLLAIQKEEFSLKQREVGLREKELSQNHELALKSIDLQEAYMRTAPKYMFNDQLLFYVSLVVILLIVSSVFVYCLYSNNKEIAMRMIELVATAVISGGGGYAYGKNQEKEKSKKESVEFIA
jgi:hypothetical protein